MKSKTQRSSSTNDKQSSSPSIKLLNPKRQELTPEILKTFPGYENLDEESAKEQCESIKTFARILMDYFLSLEKEQGEKTSA
jgi:hypothetical protein